jgi:hypothetical protein
VSPSNLTVWSFHDRTPTRSRWADADLERGLLFLPDSKTGRKTVVLNAPAAAILAELPRLGVYVIAGDDAGKEGEKQRRSLLSAPSR